MAKLTFILGGARSGKSRYAIKLAEDNAKKVAFIATCQGLDQEMRSRIKSHKKRRPGHWQTFEEPKNINPLLQKIGDKFEYIIIDCLTLLISNLILSGYTENLIAGEVNKMLRRIKKIKAKVIIVANEVGLGIVPENSLARQFRDIAGRTNQVVADKAEEVFFLVSGLPSKIK